MSVAGACRNVHHCSFFSRHHPLSYIIQIMFTFALLRASEQGKHGNRWAKVASEIADRGGQQCAQRWRHKVNPDICKEPWGADEDVLVRGVGFLRPFALSHLSGYRQRHRMCDTDTCPPTSVLSPSPSILSRSQFLRLPSYLPSHSAQLQSLVKAHGMRWAVIARDVKGRTDQQCMGRWRRHLDPEVKRSEWTTKEVRSSPNPSISPHALNAACHVGSRAPCPFSLAPPGDRGGAHLRLRRRVVETAAAGWWRLRPLNAFTRQTRVADCKPASLQTQPPNPRCSILSLKPWIPSPFTSEPYTLCAGPRADGAAPQTRR